MGTISILSFIVVSSREKKNKRRCIDGILVVIESILTVSPSVLMLLLFSVIDF